MAVIKLSIVVGNLEDVLESFDRIKVYRATTGIAGTYSEITAPATRITLEDSKVVYEYTDEAGDPNYYYKSSFFHSTSGLESQLSDPQQGDGSPALDVMSVSELKTNYLFGLDLTNDAGEEYPDSLYEFFIKSAVSWLEHKLDIPIATKTIVNEGHDFYREDYDKWMWVKTKLFPILEVTEMKIVMPGNQTIMTFDQDWLQVDKDAGHIMVSPGSGVATSILLGAGGAFLPFIYSHNRFVPNAIRVSYTAGLDPMPAVIRDIVGKTASFGPLNIAGDLLGGAGIASQSVSIDGLSQSFNTTSSATSSGYGARLLIYRRELQDVIPTLQRYYKGLRMVVA